MNDKPESNRALRIAPLVLRWSLAAILIYSGLQQVGPIASGEQDQVVTASAEGVSLSANWDSLLGLAEMGVGGLLAVGFLTRAIALAVIAVVLYGGSVRFGYVGIAPASIAERMSQISAGAMMLLGAASASLLVSGCGSLGLDSLRGRRRSKVTSPAAA